MSDTPQPPKIIWLQWLDEDGDRNHPEEITWCDCATGSRDVGPYVLQSELERENAALRAALDNLRAKIAEAAKADCRKLHDFELIALAIKEAQP